MYTWLLGYSCRTVVLNAWPWGSSIAPPGNLAEMQILGCHSWPTDLESLEKWGPASCVLTTPVNSQSRSRLTSHASELNERHQNRWNSPGSALEAVSKTKLDLKSPWKVEARASPKYRTMGLFLEQKSKETACNRSRLVYLNRSSSILMPLLLREGKACFSLLPGFQFLHPGQKCLSKGQSSSSGGEKSLGDTVSVSLIGKERTVCSPKSDWVISWFWPLWMGLMNL